MAVLSAAEKKLLALLGKDVEEVAESIEETSQASLEAEAMLDYLKDPRGWTRPKPCLHCELTFVANRPSVGYCSDRCRKVALSELGLTWNPEKTPEARWGHSNAVPLVVPPHALDFLRGVLISEPMSAVLPQ